LTWLNRRFSQDDFHFAPAPAAASPGTAPKGLPPDYPHHALKNIAKPTIVIQPPKYGSICIIDAVQSFIQFPKREKKLQR
jgi:hypothetical protein